MKSIYYFLSFLLLAFFSACVDDAIIEEGNKNLPPDTNYKEFSEGYSLAFNINLDALGGNLGTRADADDVWLAELEEYLDPEEFRVLVFNEKDQFLFESKTRWLTEIDPKNGNRCWRIGVPVFQYLSDNFDDNNPDNDDGTIDAKYNWNEIVEYMKTHPFKICILANRPEHIDLPVLTDYETNMKEIYPGAKWNDGFGDVGPFWTAKNSALTTLEDLKKWETKDAQGNLITTEEERANNNDTEIKTVFDLHHCQYDPIYDAKNQQNAAKDEGAYKHLMKYVYDPKWSPSRQTTSKLVPYMGAVSSWIGDEKRYISSDGGVIASETEYNPEGTEHTKGGKSLNARSFYRLPEDRFGKENKSRINIPMYGIQKFNPITDWTKGTTYNISEQTASQAKDYVYRSIFLLRSVVKLELRIPMYKNDGSLNEVDLNYAAIFHNNYMARNEPMDVSSPTDSIWESNHVEKCEWLRLKEYGAYISNTDAYTGNNMQSYRTKMAWYYGSWLKMGWDFNGEKALVPDEKSNPEYPHIFNPIVQRLQATFISNNFLPIGIPREAFVNPEWTKGNKSSKNGNDDELGTKYTYNGNEFPKTRKKAEEIYPSSQGYYYRWVIYCGEKNINDANTLGYCDSGVTNGTTSHAYVSCFRVKIGDKIYLLPITNYKDHKSANPVSYLFSQEDDRDIKSTEIPRPIQGGTNSTTNVTFTSFSDKVADLEANSDYLPYPLMRNHFYRMTCSFGDGDELNIEIIDAEERNIGDILFGKNR